MSTGVEMVSEMLKARHAVHARSVGVMSRPTNVSARSKITDHTM